MDETSASFLDKTDWRTTLHRKLEACVDAEGTPYYRLRVKSLISAYSAEYPGWDAKSDLEKNIHLLEQKYTVLWDEWVKKNSSAKRWSKYNYRKLLYDMLHKDIFEYIKNMCAKKRMLLWGTKKTPGGEEIQITSGTQL